MLRSVFTLLLLLVTPPSLAQPRAPAAPSSMHLPPENPLQGPEYPSATRGYEVLVTQGLGGLGVGLGAALTVELRNPGSVFAAGLLGGALGFAAAGVLTRGGITPGQGAAVNAGTLFGGLGALLLSLAIGDARTAPVVGALFAGGLTLGSVGGALVAVQRPLSARVTFAGHFGFWCAALSASLYLGTKGFGSFGPGEHTVEVFGTSTLASLGGGLLLGALLSPQVRMSPTRT